MTTTVIYNGVTMHDVQTEMVDYTPEYDSSGADPLYTRVQFSFVCPLRLENAPQYTSTEGLGLALNNGTVPDAWHGVYERLLQPRRNFRMLIGSKTLFHIWPAATRGTGLNAGIRNSPGVPDAATLDDPQNNGWRKDLNNGPRTSASFLRITGTHSAYIRFRVEAHISTCDVDGYNRQSTFGILNLRWSFADDVDGTDYSTTRTTSGNLRVISPEYNPHTALRTGFVLPPLQYGFRRQSLNTSSSPDGLNIAFRMVDREERIAPPAPATSWRVRHRISSPKPGGAVVHSSLSVELSAPKNVHKHDLVARAIDIIDQKTHLIESINNRTSGAVMLNCSFDDDVTGNGLAAHLTYLHHPNNKNPKHSVLNQLLNTFGQPLTFPSQPNWDPGRWPNLQPTAAATGLYNALLQDGCHPAAMPQSVQIGGSPADPYEPTEGVEDTIETANPQAIQDNLDYYTTAHEQDPYMSQEMVSELSIDDGRYALPVAGGPAGVNTRMIKFHRPIYRRSIVIDAERVGAPPIMLNSDDFVQSGAPHRNLSAIVSPLAPIVAADGRHVIYRAHGDYEYDLASAPTNVPYVRQEWHSAPASPLVLTPPGTPGAPV